MGGVALVAGVMLVGGVVQAIMPESRLRTEDAFPQGWWTGAEAAMESGHFEDAVNGIRAASAEGDVMATLWLGMMQAAGAGVEIDPFAAQRELERAADQGSQLAAAVLVSAFSDRIEDSEVLGRLQEQARRPSLLRERLPRSLAVERRGLVFLNYKEAYRWNRNAAEEGVVFALYNVAQYELRGILGSSDLNTCIEFLRRAADRGHGRACLELSTFLKHDLPGFPADPELAAAYEVKAAEAGMLAVQLKFARDYENGRDGRALDRAEARRWYATAAAQEDPFAMKFYADFLRLSPLEERDDVLAVDLYQRAIQAGRGSAKAELGYMVENGRGVDKSRALARELYREAGQAGNSWGWARLGQMLRRGIGGPVDFTGAIEVLEEGARLGSNLAKWELARMLQAGEGGPSNPARAFELFEEAARDGEAAAQYSLGLMLFDGVGVPRDRVEAVHWLQLASNKQYHPAVRHLSRLAKEWGAETGPLADMDEWAGAIPTEVLEQLERLKELLLQLEDLVEPEEAKAALDELRSIAALGDSDSIRDVAESMLCKALIEVPFPELRDLDAAFGLAEQLYHWRVRSAMLTLAVLSFVETPERPRDPERGYAILDELGAAPDHPFWGFVATRLLFLGARLQDAEAIAISHSMAIAASRVGHVDEQDLAAYWQRVLSWGSRLDLAPPISDEEAARRTAALGPRPETCRPVPIHQVQVLYPRSLQKANVGGRVSVLIVVDHEGRVATASVESADHPRLEAAALGAVRRWRFAPGLKDGVPVNYRMRLPVVFDPQADPAPEGIRLDAFNPNR